MTSCARKRYTVKIARLPEDGPDILRLWGEAFPALAGAAGERKLDAMYTVNPAGRGSLFLLQAPDGSVVGVMGLGSRSYSFGDKTVRAGMMVDLAVAAGHRALGPALVLLRGAVTGSRDGFDFLCGFPNERSEPVLVRAGYRKLGAMARYGRPLRSAPYLGRRFGRWWGRVLAPPLDVVLWLRDLGQRAFHARTSGYREADAFDPSFDPLWTRCSERPLLMAERSRRMLSWYFSELAGDRQWRVSTIRTAGSGELQAYVVWRIAGKVAHVADFLWADAIVGRVLLERTAWSARRRGCTSVTVEFSGATDVVSTLRDARFRPRESHPVYHVSGDSTSEPFFDEWYLTSFDRDAV